MTGVSTAGSVAVVTATPDAPSSAPPRGRRLDTVLILLCLALAFLAASFAVRNSDLFLHLAAGRLLAEGRYEFGTDPFASTTAGVYWANHAWLFDLGLYVAWLGLGGAGLVVLKAVALAATAGLMLAAGRLTAPVWLAVGCTLLGVTAASPRLLLQPAVASYLLLAATLVCLASGGRLRWVVPALIALWVNLDGWFWLGPALVGLFALGRRLNPAATATDRWSWAFGPACLIACLASPHHLHALRPPAELSPAVWGSALRTDPRFAAFFASPWQAGMLGPSGGFSLAAGAFAALLGLGALSFVVNRQARMDWRLCVWLPFAALAAWQARLVPFFAVVAAPITAGNLGELLPPGRGDRTGRVAVVILGLTLGGLAALGHLSGWGHRDRAVAWAIVTDPALEQAARGLAAHRDTLGIGAGHIFIAHPDLAHYLAWFAPEVRGFLDSRLTLFVTVAGDYVSLSRSLGLLTEGGGDAAEAARRHDVVAAAVYDPDPVRLTRSVTAVARGETAGWRLARVEGGTLLLTRDHSPGTPPPFDPDRAAFANASGPLPESAPAVLAAVPAPTIWPRSWFVRPPNPVSAGGATAGLYLRLYEGRPTVSPAWPWLAVRAARRALSDRSSDPTTWLVLGRAYEVLGGQTGERDLMPGLTLLQTLRHIQAVTALTQAVIHAPDSFAARDSLASVLIRRNALDLAYRHAAEAARLLRRAGPVPGEPAAAFAERLRLAAERAEQLEVAVFDAQNRFVVRTHGLSSDPLARARIAGELGLPQQAIDVLLASHPDLYGAEGLSLLADLLLQTGQAAECRVLLEREELRRHPEVLGLATLPGWPHPDGRRWSYQLPAYDWFTCCVAAAAGDHAAACAALDRIDEQLAQFESEGSRWIADAIVRQFTADLGSGLPPAPLLARLPGETERQRLVEYLRQSRFLTVVRGDLQTLAGLLEFERGATTAADDRFRAALRLYDARRGEAPSLPGEPVAARYDEAIRQQRWP